MNLNQLPAEVLLIITSELVNNPRDGEILKGMEDLSNLALASKIFSELSKDKEIWNEFAKRWNEIAPSIKLLDIEQPGLLTTIKNIWNKAKYLYGAEIEENLIRTQTLEFINTSNQKAISLYPDIPRDRNPFGQYQKVINYLNLEALHHLPPIRINADPLKQHELLKQHLKQLSVEEYFGRQIGWTGVQDGLPQEQMDLLRYFDEIAPNDPLVVQYLYTNFIFEKAVRFMNELYR